MYIFYVEDKTPHLTLFYVENETDTNERLIAKYRKGREEEMVGVGGSMYFVAWISFSTFKVQLDKNVC